MGFINGLLKHILHKKKTEEAVKYLEEFKARYRQEREERRRKRHNE